MIIKNNYLSIHIRIKRVYNTKKKRQDLRFGINYMESYIYLGRIMHVFNQDNMLRK